MLHVVQHAEHFSMLNNVPGKKKAEKKAGKKTFSVF
jgi:hypothetical protein